MIMEGAEFWTSWSSRVSSVGDQIGGELPSSSREVTQLWTKMVFVYGAREGCMQFILWSLK